MRTLLCFCLAELCRRSFVFAVEVLFVLKCPWREKFLHWLAGYSAAKLVALSEGIKYILAAEKFSVSDQVAVFGNTGLALVTVEC